MPEYQRGSGPNALPQGGASQLNANTPPPAEVPDLTPGDIPVEYGTPLPVEESSMKDSENMNLLTGPHDPAFKPGPADETFNHVPRNVVRQLPIWAVASKDPEAPPGLRVLYKALVARLQAEQGDFS